MAVCATHACHKQATANCTQPCIPTTPTHPQLPFSCPFSCSPIWRTRPSTWALTWPSASCLVGQIWTSWQRAPSPSLCPVHVAHPLLGLRSTAIMTSMLLLLAQMLVQETLMSTPPRHPQCQSWLLVSLWCKLAPGDRATGPALGAFWLAAWQGEALCPSKFACWAARAV
jgi:hypothetical protein